VRRDLGPTPGPAYPIPSQPWTAGLAEEVINSVGATDFPASYGGMKVTDDRDLVIYLAGQDPALVAEVDSLAGRAGMHVTYVGVPYSADTWGPLRNACRGLSDPEGRGLAIEVLSGDLVNGVVDVTLETPTNVPSSVQSVLLTPPRLPAHKRSWMPVWRRPAGRAVADDAGPVAIS